MTAVDVKDARNGNFAGFYLCVLLILMANANRSASANDQQVINDNVTVANNESLETEGISNSLLNVSLRALDLYRQCDADFFGRDFFFTTLNYPEYYDNNLECTFIVHRAEDVCELQLVFQSFEVEESEGCFADYLEVNGQRFCGSLPSNTLRTFAFAGSELRLRFSTNAANTKQGFLIRGSQTACSTGRDLDESETQLESRGGSFSRSFCDCSFSQLQFTISSPNFPASYEPNLDCNYAIRKSKLDICYLEVMFEFLDLDSSQNCLIDYLDFDQRRLCFLDKVRTHYFEFRQSIFNIRFHSGANRSFRTGFQLRLRQLPCAIVPPPSPRPPPIPPNPFGFCHWGISDGQQVEPLLNIQPLRFELRSAGFPATYPNNEQCVYTVRKALPSICFLEFITHSFDLEMTPNCQHDFLSVGGQRFCGVLQPGTTKIFHFPLDGEIPIRFVSDADQSGHGFSMIFQQKECSVRPTPPEPPRPPLPNQCNAFFTSDMFQISSPLLETSNTRCTYTIRKVPNVAICALQIKFIEFDFGHDSLHCDKAFLDIKGEKMCEKSIEGTIRSYVFQDQLFFIQFWSGFQRPRFRLDVSQRSCAPHPNPTPLPPTTPRLPTSPPWKPSSCGSLVPNHISSRTFQLHSLHYPAPYEANLNCEYVVTKTSPHVCRLQIQLGDFDVEQSSRCQNDFLEIAGVRLCGCHPPGTVKYFDFYGAEMIIRFHSNQLISGRGFRLDAMQLDCYNPSPSPIPDPIPYPVPSYYSCNRTYQVPEVTLQSPLYPSPYPPGLHCFYIICKTRQDICHLEVEFVFFHLGSASACGAGDFLDIGGQRHCGIIPAGTIRRYDFLLDSLTITFKTQSDSSSGAGFLLQLRQISCTDFVPIPSPVYPYYPTPIPPLGGCDTVNSQSKFVWTSPSYPASYGQNQDCHLSIQRNNPSVCSLLIQFNHFDLESSLGCIKDYLEIFGQRLCGSLNAATERSFPFNQDRVILKFHSDNHGTSSGFHATIIQQDCLDGPIFRISNALTLNATKRESTTESAAEILTGENVHAI